MLVLGVRSGEYITIGQDIVIQVVLSIIHITETTRPQPI